MKYTSVRDLGITLFLFGAFLIPKYGMLDFAIFFGGATVIIDIVFLNLKFNLSRSIVHLILFLFIVVLFSVFTFILYSDPFGLIRAIRVLMIFFITAYLSRYIEWDHFLKIITISILINTSLLYVEYLDLWGGRHLIQLINEVFYNNRDVGYRAKGMFHGYSAAGIFSGSSSVFLFYLLNTVKKHLSLHSYLFYLLLFIITTVSTLFTSRTGMLISFFGISLIVIFKFKEVFSIKNLIVLTIFISVSLYFLFSLALTDDMNITLIRSFEVYYNYINGSGLSSASTSSLQETFTIPSQFPDLIVGNGKQPWGGENYIGSSDSGYIQTLHLFGFIGFFLYYFPIAYILIISLLEYMKSKNFFAGLAFIIGVMIAISDVKGHYLYSNAFFVLYSVPFFIFRCKKTSKNPNTLKSNMN